MMEILYQDPHICVVIKPARVLSTDEPGGVPELLRQELGDPEADVRTVHRLDRVVSGLMVLARNTKAASELSRQVREDEFQKEYLAVVNGRPEYETGKFWDLLLRDKARKMTFVTETEGKGVQPASLRYRVLKSSGGMSRVWVRLETGRTHQIRVQFASRGMPLVGERKYAVQDDDCEIALWSYRVGFRHPTTGEWMTFSKEPPAVYPWTEV
jgi:23S rRNA pseudouridine1911/1915/1917 synthase